MRRINAFNTWIEAGYNQFAAEGLEGIQVERLARITSLNKSGYYHYFGDRDIFLQELMNQHVRNAEQLTFELRRMKQIDPDFIHILLKHPVPIMVHMQLVRNRHEPLLVDTYNKINGFTDQAVLNTWAEFIGTPDNPQFALKYFRQARDMFYSRISFERMNYKFLHELLYEVKELLQEATYQSSNLQR